MTALSAIATPFAADQGNFLVKHNLGVMIWTLIAFGLTMAILAKLVFPRISEALDKRQKAIESSIDTAERTREEADKLLAEYRERLAEARAQSDEIVKRAREVADTHERDAKERGREIGEEAAKKAQRDIEAATQRALGEIRKEVANLTIMATEKVTRKTLDSADQKRLVEEALGELDFSGISSAEAASN
jgi:F-type H+-transporting ATPase subunit b